MAKKKEDKNKLNPTIVKSEISQEQQNALLNIAQDIKNSDVIPKSDDSADSFFREIIKSLNDTDNISTKTEYLNVSENFAGTRLEFYSEFAFMPFLKNFVRTFETKRVSLERKGRKELIMALQEKHQEMKQDKLQNFAKMFDVS